MYQPSVVQRQIERNVLDFSQPAEAFLQGSMGDLQVEQVPAYLVGINNLLSDLQEHEFSLDPVMYTSLRVHLHNVQDSLEQAQLLEALPGPPAPPGKSWVIEDGRRKLDINLDDLKALCDEGAIDEDIGDVLGCCRKTVQRRRAELGMMKREFSPISRDNLVLVSRVFEYSHSNSVRIVY
jgi:hypothetical protein